MGTRSGTFPGVTVLYARLPGGAERDSLHGLTDAASLKEEVTGDDASRRVTPGLVILSVTRLAQVFHFYTRTLKRRVRKNTGLKNKTGIM